MLQGSLHWYGFRGADVLRFYSLVAITSITVGTILFFYFCDLSSVLLGGGIAAY